ncbi:hypothetical protein J2Y45_006797 [Dyadobacter sp. BE34]|uniref:Uncharacterized protein n=1 Tax=Dyadobacter fermentans TaxID=94254 RepID=A0ABU1R8J8_9BACT|nr:hypothetical protein [Dyadobacter fermentans]MDR7047463.1 hypothetical protein [Dyadobacter sp. BE242]MDR7201633.1 hypothetical protein [Dyadobacter sp. BE34]MDR7219503.1 hypothetical protein [Dyadobacter sp. BE31]MDR7267270.1 hypothetical protein [Dyadobacter sp. BE32]
MSGWKDVQIKCQGLLIQPDALKESRQGKISGISLYVSCMKRFLMKLISQNYAYIIPNCVRKSCVLQLSFVYINQDNGSTYFR